MGPIRYETNASNTVTDTEKKLYAPQNLATQVPTKMKLKNYFKIL